MATNNGMSLYRFCKDNGIPRTTGYERCLKLGIDTSKIPSLTCEEVKLLREEFLKEEPEPIKAEIEVYELPTADRKEGTTLSELDGHGLVGSLSVYQGGAVEVLNKGVQEMISHATQATEAKQAGALKHFKDVMNGRGGTLRDLIKAKAALMARNAYAEGLEEGLEQVGKLMDEVIAQGTQE